MQLKWSWGAPDPEPEKSWWALLIEAGELVGEWFCQGFVLFCLRYMSLNELGFWKKYINLTVDVQDVKSRQVGLAITSTFRRGKGCLSEGHLQGETKQGSSICDIMRSCRKSERHKSCQIVFQQIKWHVKLDQFDKTEKTLTTTLTTLTAELLNSVRCSGWQLKLIMAVLEAFRLVQCHNAMPVHMMHSRFTSTYTQRHRHTHIQVTYTQLFSVWRSSGALHDTKLLKCFFYVRRKPRPASGGGIQRKVKGSKPSLRQCHLRSCDMRC